MKHLCPGNHGINLNGSSLSPLTIRQTSTLSGITPYSFVFDCHKYAQISLDFGDISMYKLFKNAVCIHEKDEHTGMLQKRKTEQDREEVQTQFSIFSIL